MTALHKSADVLPSPTSTSTKTWTPSTSLSACTRNLLIPNARIRNPLGDIPRETLLADVEAFAHENGLTDIIPQLKKGALVAQDPTNYENLDLTDEEKQALRQEVTHKWKHPMALYVTIVVCSIGAAVQGWDQTGSNGANLSFPDEFGIGAGGRPAGPDNPNHDRDNWIVGLVNAAPYIA